MIYDLAQFLDDLTACFFPMKHADELAEARWMGLVKRKLANYKGPVLQEAAESLQTTRTTRSFPSLAEMIKACERAAPRPEVNPETAWVKPGDAVGKHFQDLEYWQKCVAHKGESELFARSAKENWHTGLKQFMVEHRRLPQEGEIKGCRMQADAFLEAYEHCVRGGWPLAKRFEVLGDALMRAREELRTRLLGGQDGR